MLSALRKDVERAYHEVHRQYPQACVGTPKEDAPLQLGPILLNGTLPSFLTLGEHTQVSGTFQ